MSFRAHLVGGFNPPKNMKVRWDNSSQFMENKIHVPNHQPHSTWTTILYNYLIIVPLSACQILNRLKKKTRKCSFLILTIADPWNDEFRTQTYHVMIVKETPCWSTSSFLPGPGCGAGKPSQDYAGMGRWAGLHQQKHKPPITLSKGCAYPILQ